MSARRTVHDPDTYAKVSEPFPDSNAAQAALDEFFEAVRGLRVRCGIRDVQMVAVVNVVDPDAPGGVTSAIGGWHLGNPAIAPRLLAFQAGRYERERAEELESYRQQGLTSPEIK